MDRRSPIADSMVKPHSAAGLARYRREGAMRRPTTAHARQRGVVMVLVLLAMLLLVGLVFYVINLGRQVNRRVVTQNAADAAAMGGADWVARSLNVVSMNNVEMARLIATINILDSVPLAIDLSYKDASETLLGDESAMYLAIDHQLRAGVADDVYRRELVRARNMLGTPMGAARGTDFSQLDELNNLFKNRPEIITEVTYFRAPSGGPGQAWRAMYALDNLSQVTLENIGLLAQLNAIDAGEINLSSDGAALVAPLVPQVPTVRGSFDDFRRPVLQGLLPTARDNKITNRGPYDTVYGWRITDGSDPQRPRDYLADPPGWSPGSEGRPPSGYRVYGPHDWLLQQYRNTLFGSLPYQLRRVANVKLRYLWPSYDGYVNDPFGSLYETDWEVDVERDNEASANDQIPGFSAGDPDDTRMKLDAAGQTVPLCSERECHTAYEYAQHHLADVHETMFMELDLYHSGENNPFLESEQYRGMDRLPNGNLPTWYIRNGRLQARYTPPGRIRDDLNDRGPHWQDPESGPPGGFARSNIPGEVAVWRRVSASSRRSWKETIAYETNPNVPAGRYIHGGYPEIGLVPIQTGTDANGRPVYRAQRYYRTRYFLFVGINVGPGNIVRNPYEGFNRSARSAPAPIDLDPSRLPSTNNTAARQQYLTYLGVGRRGDRAPDWPSKFDGGKPWPNMVAIAQAEVFNDHSWDLWTQMWRARLAPVSGFNRWVNEFGSDYDSSVLSPTDVDELRQYFTNIAPLAPVMLNH
ncbi:MAG: hypothetical protein IT444_07490 [Phycisphaeraceae bacterium]|nr:hypothetical protein [Phycisphaeraceae bacterium]